MTVSIFYNKKEKPINRKYWIGTVTTDGTSCEDVIKTIPGKGKIALQKAKQFLKNL